MNLPALYFCAATVIIFLCHIAITDGLHRLAHSGAWPWLKEFHLRGHHAEYPGHFVSHGYRHPKGFYNAPVLFGLAMALISPVFAVFFFLEFPPVVLGYSLVIFLAFGWFHTWTHEEFHNADSRLRRFHWYRRLVKLHMVHHAMDEYLTDGKRIVNLGGYTFWIDILLGSFQERLPADYKSERARPRLTTNGLPTSLPSG